ncbi:MAG: histidine kinase [Reichenbachiella sp.]|uniref:sensor histidine kinase n=1 Tax=Reichenbachiella sp. TaxID=2184521 RepID=UPI003266B046
MRKKKWLGYFIRLVVLLVLIEFIRALVIAYFEHDNILFGFSQTFSLNPFADRSLYSYCSLALLLSFGYKFTKDWILNIGEIDRLKAERLAMELAFLKSQVDPHFLFNTLNSLYALALEEKSEKTADGIVKLSTLMRYNLHDSQATLIPMSKEVNYIEKYLDLQRLRATKQTTINFEVEGSTDGIEIAPVLLIPFIENAFKYSHSPIEPNFVDIAMKFDKSSLLLIVKNSISQVASPDDNTGIGLENVKNRLELLYAERYHLEISHHPDTFSVKLEINLDT